MNNIILILLVVAIIKFILVAVILWFIFRREARSFFGKPEPPSSPTCIYCRSVWTHQVGESETRWEGNELLLVTTYECQHCHFPTTHVEHVKAGAARR